MALEEIRLIPVEFIQGMTEKYLAAAVVAAVRLSHHPLPSALSEQLTEAPALTES